MPIKKPAAPKKRGRPKKPIITPPPEAAQPPQPQVDEGMPGWEERRATRSTEIQKARPFKTLMGAVKREKTNPVVKDPIQPSTDPREAMEHPTGGFPYTDKIPAEPPAPAAPQPSDKKPAEPPAPADPAMAATAKAVEGSSWTVPELQARLTEFYKKKTAIADLTKKIKLAKEENEKREQEICEQMVFMKTSKFTVDAVATFTVKQARKVYMPGKDKLEERKKLLAFLFTNANASYLIQAYSISFAEINSLQNALQEEGVLEEGQTLPGVGAAELVLKLSTRKLNK